MINHFQLYQTLMKQRVSVAFLNIIINWYSKLSIVVRWNTMFSDTLRVRSGVRQGGVHVLLPWIWISMDISMDISMCGYQTWPSRGYIHGYFYLF